MTSFLLVHGGFCGSWVWDDVTPALRAGGHRVETVDLPSSGTDGAALGDLHADVAVVRDALDGLGDDVVMVGHSGGGFVLAEFADHPAVGHAVFVAALWPQNGQSALDLLGGQVPDWMSVKDDGSVGVSSDAEVVRQALCAEVDAQRFAADIHPRYLLTSISSLSTPSSAPAWTHPTTYIVCEQDRAIPPAAQEAMSAAADHVERLPSGHAVMLSMPSQLADVLGRIPTTSHRGDAPDGR